MEYSTSPERGSFYRGIWKKQLESGQTTQELYDNMMQILDREKEFEQQRDKSFDLEYDLRSNQRILDKARNSKAYCQNLYSALCNNRFFYGDKEWTCTWRHAGGIVADMIQKGDYIDWYCGGDEGLVTEEISLDLMMIGWTIKPYENQ